MCMCVCVCVYACVRVRACVCVGGGGGGALRTVSMDKILGFTNILIIYPLFLNTHSYVIKKKASHSS